MARFFAPDSSAVIRVNYSSRSPNKKACREVGRNLQHEMRESITVYDPQSRQDATSFCPYGPTIYEPEWDHFVANLD